MATPPKKVKRHRGTEAPKCELCGTRHWLRDGHATAAVVPVAGPPAEHILSLATIGEASRMLAEMQSLEDVQQVRGLAEAAVAYAKAHHLGIEAENHAGGIAVEAAIRQGEILDDMLEKGLRRGPGRYGRGKSSIVEPLPSFPELGTTKSESAVVHRLAARKAAVRAWREEASKKEEKTPKERISVAAAVRVVKAAEREEAKVAKAARQAALAPTQALVSLARWEDWLPAQPECDLLLTDPPYSTEVEAEDVEAFARKWLHVALAKVKRSGRAYVCIGAYPRELAAYLAVAPPSWLTLEQVLVWTYRNRLGPKPTHDYVLNWQAVLYYRGEDAPPLNCPEMAEQFAVQEINAPDGRQGDHWHEWQKPDLLADRFVAHATKPGDIVLDPFAGTGSFLLAAARAGRAAFGCERDEEMWKLAIERGCTGQGAMS